MISGSTPEHLAQALAGKFAVDVDDTRADRLFKIAGVYQHADGSNGPDTSVMLTNAVGEFDFVLLSTLRDRDYFHLYLTEDAAKKALELEQRESAAA